MLRIEGASQPNGNTTQRILRGLQCFAAKLDQAAQSASHDPGFAHHDGAAIAGLIGHFDFLGIGG